MLENHCLGFSSIDKNIKASYKLLSIKKWEWLNTVIQYQVGWENYIFDDYELIEYK